MEYRLRAFLVLYDLVGSEFVDRNYQGLEHFLKSRYPVYCHLQQSAWVILARGTSDSVLAELSNSGYFDYQDRLCVSQVNPSNMSFMGVQDREVSKWIAEARQFYRKDRLE